MRGNAWVTFEESISDLDIPSKEHNFIHCLCFHFSRSKGQWQMLNQYYYHLSFMIVHHNTNSHRVCKRENGSINVHLIPWWGRGSPMIIYGIFISRWPKMSELKLFQKITGFGDDLTGRLLRSTQSGFYSS